MSTRIPWFRYGFRETKRWLRTLRQKRARWAIPEIRDALARDRRINDNDIWDAEAELSARIADGESVRSTEIDTELGAVNFGATIISRRS